MNSTDFIPATVIAAKRDRQELSDAQIEFFIRAYTAEQIPDYQMAALTMAVYLNGMSERETATLTNAMLDSGARLRWPSDGLIRADKHSTGGVGDKTSIILAPLLAECGLQIPMLSGRGLGATGGTLDKLEAISGFRTNLTLAEITQQTLDIGCVITGASAELAPADRRLYALRDVTATVPSIPLITASIMSKKLAESPDALVLDVKFGSGAFMKTHEQAALLAQSLVATGEQMNVRTTALLTDMNQPLGRMCGNAVEILESIAILQNGGPPDARELTIALATELLINTGICRRVQQARELLNKKLGDGSAFERYQRMVRAQGGDPEAELVVAPMSEFTAADSGFVSAIDTEQLGLAIIAMKGGRSRMGDVIDHSVGLEMLVRIGDPVEAGQPLVRVFSKSPDAVRERVLASFAIGERTTVPELIVEHVDRLYEPDDG